MKESRTETCHLFTDDEIVRFAEQARPRIIGMDAPLSLPRGRTSIHERNDKHLRECDRELTRNKIRFFPVTLGPMRKLPERGMALKGAFEEIGIDAFEIYPGGAQDIYEIPRKQKGMDLLLSGLRELGIAGLNSEMSDHELDAATGAFVLQSFLAGKARAWGNPDEGLIVMPDPIHP